MTESTAINPINNYQFNKNMKSMTAVKIQKSKECNTGVMLNLSKKLQILFDNDSDENV